MHSHTFTSTHALKLQSFFDETVCLIPVCWHHKLSIASLCTSVARGRLSSFPNKGKYSTLTTTAKKKKTICDLKCGQRGRAESSVPHIQNRPQFKSVRAQASLMVLKGQGLFSLWLKYCIWIWREAAALPESYIHLSRAAFNVSRSG